MEDRRNAKTYLKKLIGKKEEESNRGRGLKDEKREIGKKKRPSKAFLRRTQSSVAEGLNSVTLIPLAITWRVASEKEVVSAKLLSFCSDWNNPNTHFTSIFALPLPLF